MTVRFSGIYLYVLDCLPIPARPCQPGVGGATVQQSAACGECNAWQQSFCEEIVSCIALATCGRLCHPFGRGCSHLITPLPLATAAGCLHHTYPCSCGIKYVEHYDIFFRNVRAPRKHRTADAYALVDDSATVYQQEPLTYKPLGSRE